METWSFLWDKKIIFPSPVIQKNDGTERWEIASWKKKILTDFVESLGDGFKLKSIRRTHLKNIFLPNLLPNLTEKQWETVELASKRNYYNHPRGTNLDALAKERKVSKQTLQQHLRIAEKKLIGYLTKMVR